jgi:hypothetical protein
MSLDIYLVDNKKRLICQECDKKINNKKYQYCPWCGEKISSEVHSQNITHNVNKMWMNAGCYDALYNSEGKKAKTISKILFKAIINMEENKEKYEKLNSPNGWGLYIDALPWLKELYSACMQYPDSIICVSK